MLGVCCLQLFAAVEENNIFFHKKHVLNWKNGKFWVKKWKVLSQKNEKFWVRKIENF